MILMWGIKKKRPELFIPWLFVLVLQLFTPFYWILTDIYYYFLFRFVPTVYFWVNIFILTLHICFWLFIFKYYNYLKITESHIEPFDQSDLEKGLKSAKLVVSNSLLEAKNPGGEGQ